MNELKILILKLIAVDRLPPGPVEIGKISALTHESWNDAMEDAAGVSKALFASTQGTEVLYGLGGSRTIQSHFDASRVLSANADIKVHSAGYVSRLLPEKTGKHTTNHVQLG